MASLLKTSGLVVLLVTCVAATAWATPLDDYVNLPDNHYSYTILQGYRIPGEYTAYVVNMTSQMWLTYNDSDSAIWFHYLTITIPERIVDSEHAFLFITGGSTHSSPPDPRTDDEIRRTSNIAVGAGIVGATLRQVPNQPVVFKTDPKQMKRYEDAVIAFTWHHFLYNGTNEPNWLLRLPMTKAAVRAMDTITDVVYNVNPNQNISKFIVAGESKRGWTTWTTGAVDKRVVAIAPIVLDLLNMAKNMHHHYRSLGGWTMEFNDYYDENITLFMDTPQLVKMAAIVDPFAYKDRLSMPKFIVTAGSDEFFLPDDSYYYFDELPGPKYLSITPNDEHELRFHNLELTHQLTSFVRTVIRPNEWMAPNMTWNRYENATHGILEFISDPIPLKVEVFRTLTNRGPRRDFRWAVADPPGTTDYSLNVILYKTFPFRNPEPGKYIAEFLTPEIGWQCFFIRATYNTPGDTTITFTTEASINPANKFAVPDCRGIGCKATILATPLDDYVNMPDNHYQYTVLKEQRVPGQYIVYTVNMTSQKWLTAQDSSTSIWWHYLIITIPDQLTHPEHGFLWITGGSTSYSPPDPLSDTEMLRTSNIAVGAGVVGGTLKQVPNQPCVFTTDPKQKKRYEDAIIAFTWKHFIENGTDEPYWLLRMPMTKAAVRAMDTMTDLVYRVRPGPQNVTKFIVAGESKRGWTTWTTGAVDKRVVGIAPTVLDLLNMVKNLHHHYRSLGGWTWVFNDYYEENVTLYLDDPNTQKMADIVDPISYKDRLTMPKLIVTAGSDEFFLPDDSYYYFDELPEPKYLHIVPNDEHELSVHNLELTHLYTSFILSITEPNQWVEPNLSWNRYENSTHGIIEFSSDPAPIQIEAFRTLTNRGSRRDFRLAVAETPGSSKGYPNLILYKKFSVRSTGPGKYVAEFQTPPIGWQCFFIRAHYPAPNNTTISFTTEANITPTEKFAVPDCHGAGCRGILV